jgi:hypothetical protein
LAINISARQKCELTLNEAPVLQNLRLGMSSDEASNVLGIKVKIKSVGQRTFFKNYLKQNAKGRLIGTRAMFLRFYEGKLYQIEFFYDQAYRWQTLESLLEDYSMQNNFPKEFWQTKYGYANANCNGFSLNADYILNPHIQLTNDGIAELVEEEREKSK